jgi:hypothetical protein
MTHISPRALRVCASLGAACFFPWVASAQPARVDAKADQLLRAMTTYMAGLPKLSVKTENSLEAVTADGQKVQFVAPATLTFQRPDKLVAQRQGDVADQRFIYDGKTLTLFNPGSGHYSTVPAPANLDAMLEFAQTKLDVTAPGSDLIDTRAYDKLMQDVKTGTYIGLEVVGGQRCHHLAYQGAEVDWQLWVRDGDRPLPCRYVITSKNIAGAPQFTMQVVGADTNPKTSPEMFRFVPPAGAKAVEFLPLATVR